MAKQKFYAVKKGFNTGIFYDWNTCKKNIQGYSGAVYKSFFSLEEANSFLQNKTVNIKEEDLDNVIVAYVDGSFNNITMEYGSGIVILKNKKIIEEFSIKGTNKDSVSMRNVAGEIEAAMFAMEYCVKNKYKNLVLYYDYEGVEKWCTGIWKANKKGTQQYKSSYDLIKDKLNVFFKKVKAHSGDKYNDIADKLAKNSVNLL